MSITPTPNIDYTNKDYESFRNSMLNELGIKMPEYTDRSQTDAGIVLIELLAKGLDILSYYQDVQANEAFLITAEQRASAMKWCRMLDYIPRSSTPSKVMQVFKLASPQEQDTIIPVGTRVKTKESASEYSIIFETSEELVIPANCLGDEQDEQGNYLYSVEAIQGYTIYGETIGGSNGTESQRFTLNYSPVIDSSVAVLVDEGSGFVPWTRVDSFFDSSPTSKHYMVEMTDNDNAIIVFGDGRTGKIPNAVSNNIKCTYRVGGGSQSNVGANKIVLLDSNVAKVASTFNPDVPFEEGFDKETLAEMKVNAPNSYRNKWTCLIDTDYADRVKELFPQIIFASSEVSKEDIDTINVYILHNTYPESIHQTLLKEIEDMFNERNLVGTHVNIILPNEETFIPLKVKINLVVKEGYNQDLVKSEINAMLLDRFQIGNYNFGTELSVSDVEADIRDNSDGVKLVRVSIESSISSEGDMIISPNLSQILTIGSESDITYSISGGIE